MQPQRLLRWIQLCHGVRTFRRRNGFANTVAEWLKFDAVAGITLAAYAIPVSMAYASLAGVPPHHGIYCYLLGGALLCRLRDLSAVGDWPNLRNFTISWQHGRWHGGWRCIALDCHRCAFSTSRRGPKSGWLGCCV